MGVGGGWGGGGGGGGGWGVGGGGAKAQHTLMWLFGVNMNGVVPRCQLLATEIALCCENVA